MRKILLALLALPALAFGAAYDVGIDQRPAANNVWEKRLLISPSTTGIMSYNPSTLLPVWLTLGQGLSVNSGVLSSTAAPGPTGPQGPIGLTGATGPAGPVGPAGATGLTGAKGDTGAQGPEGAIGLTGPQGPIGLTGTSGAKGEPGAQGPVGATGAQGPIGLTGPAGAAAPLPSSAVVTRALNTPFQPNATRPVHVVYSVDISVVSLLLTGTQGTVALQYADNAAMSAGLVTVLTATNSTGGVLNVANIGTATLSGFIPAGKFVRLVTTNNSGTPTFTFRNGQETVF